MTVVAAIVLAGGRSSRFGRDKLAEPVGGRPMLELAVDAVRGIAADVVVVVAPGTSPRPPHGTRLVHDATAFEGPLAGVAAGLAGVEAEIVLVVAGDAPRMVPGVLAGLVAALEAGAASDSDGEPFDAVMLGAEGGSRPLPLALRRGPAFPAAEALLASGERRLRALPASLRTLVVPERVWRQDDPDGDTLLDVDTPSDLG